MDKEIAKKMKRQAWLFDKLTDGDSYSQKAEWLGEIMNIEHELTLAERG